LRQVRLQCGQVREGAGGRTALVGRAVVLFGAGVGADDGGGGPVAVGVTGRVPACHLGGGVVVLDAVAGVAVAVGQGVDARVGVGGAALHLTAGDVQLPVAHGCDVGPCPYHAAAAGDVQHLACRGPLVAGVVAGRGLPLDPLCAGPVLVAESGIEKGGCRV